MAELGVGRIGGLECGCWGAVWTTIIIARGAELIWEAQIFTFCPIFSHDFPTA